MPVVPGFKYDLFISYAHQNDRPWGWVSEFIKTLKAELENKSRDFKVWWDPGLRTGEDFNDAIAEAISGSAVFLSVLSPAYGDSSYCKLEMEQFRNLQHRKFGLKVRNMSRMQAIVIDREFTRDRWAPEFRTTSPYEFFNEEESLFAKPSGLAPHDPWIQGLWKVRDSIWPLLQDMRRQIEEGTANDNAYVPLPPPVAPKLDQDTRPVVHVAEVTDDLFQRRENLRTALGQARDFQVVAWSEATAPPGSGLGALSVHLFGRIAGFAWVVAPAAGGDGEGSSLAQAAGMAGPGFQPGGRGDSGAQAVFGIAAELERGGAAAYRLRGFEGGDRRADASPRAGAEAGQGSADYPYMACDRQSGGSCGAEAIPDGQGLRDPDV